MLAHSRTGRLVHAEAGIALALQLVGELRSPGLHDAAVEEDVHVVRLDVSQDSRVVRDQQGPDTGLPDLVYASAYDPQRVDVETGVRLVQDGDLGLEQRHLQNLVAFLLPAGEALVEAAVGKGLVDLETGHRVIDFADPGAQLGGFSAHRGRRGTQEVRDRDARHLDWILHREKQSRAGALINRHREHVLPVQQDLALRNGVFRVTGDGVREGRLTGSVRPHNRVGLAGRHREVDAVQDLNRVDADVQVTNLKRAH